MLAVPKERLCELMTELELKPYQVYLEKGDIPTKEDLSYAVALLSQMVSCMTGARPTNSDNLREAGNYKQILRDSGGPRKRNMAGAIDAIDRMMPLFRSTEACLSFLDNELPPITISIGANVGIR